MNMLRDILADSAAFDLLLTLLAYQFGLWAYTRSRQHPLLLPVWVGLILVVGVNLLLGRSYADYLAGTQAISAFLGPVIVALAIPLHQHFGPMRQSALSLLSICVVTAVSVAATVWWLGGALGADATLQASLLPKAATTPIAIEIANSIGGIAAISAVTVLLTGVAGAMLGPPLLRALGVSDEAKIGFALGLSAHAVGTARAFEISSRCGAFAALGMCLMGSLLAIVLPLVVS